MLNKKVLRTVSILSSLAAVLTLIAAAAGLLAPGFYEPFMPDRAMLVGAYAQDLIALVAAGLMLAAILFTWRGSVRAPLIWVGCLGYLIYAYLLWSFDAVYTPLFPAYIAILSLSLFSTIGLLGQLDAQSFARFIDDDMPARSTAVVLALPVLMAPPWLMFLFQGTVAGEPAAINSVLVIDLGFIIPASLVTAVLVWRRRTWGYIFAGAMLVKMITMSGTLLISTAWGAALGAAVDPVWPVYLAMVLLGSAALVRYLQRIGRRTVVDRKKPAWLLD